MGFQFFIMSLLRLMTHLLTVANISSSHVMPSSMPIASTSSTLKRHRLMTDMFEAYFEHGGLRNLDLSLWPCLTLGLIFLVHKIPNSNLKELNYLIIYSPNIARHNENVNWTLMEVFSNIVCLWTGWKNMKIIMSIKSEAPPLKTY